MQFPGVDGRDSFERSFDLSKFPNLQEVTFGSMIGRMNQGVPWIPTALSTLRPTTSPRLSAIRYVLIDPPTNQPAETSIRNMRIDLRRIADEVVRIRREFEGSVDLTLVPGLGFDGVLGELNVRFNFCRAEFSFILHRSSSTTVAGVGQDLRRSQFAIMVPFVSTAAHAVTK